MDTARDLKKHAPAVMLKLLNVRCVKGIKEQKVRNIVAITRTGQDESCKNLTGRINSRVEMTKETQSSEEALKAKENRNPWEYEKPDATNKTLMGFMDQEAKGSQKMMADLIAKMGNTSVSRPRNYPNQNQGSGFRQSTFGDANRIPFAQMTCFTCGKLGHLGIFRTYEPLPVGDQARVKRDLDAGRQNTAKSRTTTEIPVDHSGNMRPTCIRSAAIWAAGG